MKKLGLLPKLIIGLIAGIIIGKIGFVPLLRIMLTFNGLFGNFLQFVIPLIILGFVAPGIGDLGKKAGKLLAVTTVLAYGSTIVSGSLAFFTNSILLKKILPAGAALAEGSHPEAGLLSGYLTVDMPPIMGVMTALLMAFIIGIGIAVVEGTTLKNFMNEIQTIVEKIITNIIIPFLPLYIAGIFANMTYAGEIIKIMSVFAKVFGIIIILHFVILLVQYTIAGTLAGANPLLLIRKMLPAYFTAIGTQSSAATIPVTLNQTKENGVNEGIADFTIPLCATIHLSGSTITLVSCSMAVMMLHGMPITFSGMFGFILMLGVTMVAAPGVPGGAVMAALGLLESMLGFGPELTSLMIALYLTQDSFGTACNVTGDGAIAIMVNKIAGFNLVKRVKKETIEA
ncbi:dicarboxylate/amino acid:cation symporter [Fusobacterium varium]|uniref:Dicarboxylate/amino acid:cation symporter n=1 Tax=Fusobacterium varium ATCC 27725 TaxID=469618 RepID=A0ABM6U6Y5_FUSVA|nr:dicarboxylate/amino acid:cation symporter [Fusobacterium varium]AVQ32149.1 dicarboxylate/amino acid:cation symporter [Fusobacterium varium ATCC 27725]EES63606.2 transporter, dicarboxylate/amino acid:cation Na+/H+ symporter family protein [Fusobacterium varium ATCC 27725]RGJ29601.1 dicarboxylate/amino acid:cation symporter [Fusobacterium varium]